MSPARRCTALRTDGHPCKAWAIRHSHPPLCASHAKRHSSHDVDQMKQPTELGSAGISSAKTFYDRFFTPEEVADMVSRVVSHSLNGEVAAARVALRRVMEQLEEELTPAEYARLAGLIFAGTNAIARLLQAQQSLSNQVAESIVEAMREAMNELGDNLGVEL